MRLFQIVVFKLNNCHLAHTVHTSGKFCKAWILHFRKLKGNPCTTIPLDTLYLDVFYFFGQVPCCLLNPSLLWVLSYLRWITFSQSRHCSSIQVPNESLHSVICTRTGTGPIYWDEINLSTHKKSCSSIVAAWSRSVRRCYTSQRLLLGKTPQNTLPAAHVGTSM